MAFGVNRASGERVATEASAAPAKKSFLREYGEALAVALVLALFIRTFVVQAFKIPSGSMLPTLEVGDHILVNKFAYGVRLPVTGTLLVPVTAPRRGDVIVFVYPEDTKKDFIKRIVAVEGDRVEIRQKQLFVNGEVIRDSHAHFAEGREGRGMSPRDNFGPYTVPEGAVFVMGDNRDRSYDSRFWGPVRLDRIKGKAFLIYWSWDGHESWVRFGRIGDLIY